MGAIGLGHTLQRNTDIIAKRALQWTLWGHKQKAATEHLKKETEVRNWDGKIQLQLEEHGSSGSRQNRMENLVCDVCSFRSDKV